MDNEATRQVCKEIAWRIERKYQELGPVTFLEDEGNLKLRVFEVLMQEVITDMQREGIL